MLGVILFILKLLGYLLLGILALAVLLLLFILFVPITYRVRFSYEDSFECMVHVFGLQMYPKKEYAFFKLFRRRKPDENVKPEVPQTIQEQSVSDAQVTQDIAGNKEKNKNLSEEPASADISGKTADKNQADISEKLTNIQNKTSKKLQQIKASYENAKTQLQDEHNQQAVGHAWKELLYLLKHLGPRKVIADISYSLGDPANTGLATAALSVCPFVYGKHCSIIPDFEAEELYVRGKADIRGHGRIVHVLRSGLHLLLDKDVRRLIRSIRKK